MEERLKVTDLYLSLDNEEIFDNKTFEDIIEYFKQMKEEYKDRDYNFYSKYDEITFTVYREENDEEYNKRIEKEIKKLRYEKKLEEERFNRNETRERREYERLKKKFEN